MLLLAAVAVLAVLYFGSVALTAADPEDLLRLNQDLTAELNEVKNENELMRAESAEFVAEVEAEWE